MKRTLEEALLHAEAMRGASQSIVVEDLIILADEVRRLQSAIEAIVEFQQERPTIKGEVMSAITSANVQTSYVDFPSNCINEDGNDEGICADPQHDHAPICCMWHAYEHEVGQMCLDCHRQWFYSPDWSSPECRGMRSRLPWHRRLLRWLERMWR